MASKGDSFGSGGDDELSKYGRVISGFSISGTLADVHGATIEFGYVMTNKNWVQYYYTVSSTTGAAQSVGATVFYLRDKGDHETTFSNWAGPVAAVNLSAAYGSFQTSVSSTYITSGLGGSFGASMPTFSVGWTTLVGSPIYVGEVDFTKSYMNTMMYRGGH